MAKFVIGKMVDNAADDHEGGTVIAVFPTVDSNCGTPVGVLDPMIEGLKFAEKGFSRGTKSNIDSKTDPETHDRFKTGSLLILLLLKVVPVPNFSADC